MCDCDDYQQPEIDHAFKARVTASQETPRLLKAISTLQSRDFSKWIGSGIMITLTPITPESCICDEFMISAEDLEKIKPTIIASIKDSLEMRKLLLRSELQDISKVLGTDG